MDTIIIDYAATMEKLATMDMSFIQRETVKGLCFCIAIVFSVFLNAEHVDAKSNDLYEMHSSIIHDNATVDIEFPFEIVGVLFEHVYDNNIYIFFNKIVLRDASDASQLLGFWIEDKVKAVVLSMDMKNQGRADYASNETQSQKAYIMIASIESAAWFQHRSIFETKIAMAAPQDIFDGVEEGIDAGETEIDLPVTTIIVRPVRNNERSEAEQSIIEAETRADRLIREEGILRDDNTSFSNRSEEDYVDPDSSVLEDVVLEPKTTSSNRAVNNPPKKIKNVKDKPLKTRSQEVVLP